MAMARMFGLIAVAAIILMAGAKLLELAVLQIHPEIGSAELHGRIEIVLLIAILLWALLRLRRD